MIFEYPSILQEWQSLDERGHGGDGLSDLKLSFISKGIG